MSKYMFERLTALDNSFLVAEQANQPMHVASVNIFEAGDLARPAGGIDVNRIRQALRQNRLSVKQVTMNEDARLDVMAGREYGDASLWWVIAAASNIGWGLQVPAGTRILVPTSLEQIAGLVE